MKVEQYKKQWTSAIFIFLFTKSLLLASTLDPLPEVYQNLSNIYAPTEEDLLYLQKQISSLNRPIVERMRDTAFIAKDFKIIGPSPQEKPETGWACVNSSENERENCIILYASFNRSYPRGVRRLYDIITHSNFRGHVYYRIGGWPNVSAGDLILAHVPFAFKVCFFREVQQLGYKRVLWLDASILPHADLNTIFDLITERGFFVQGNSHNVGVYMNEEAAGAFGLTLQQTQPILSCSAAILGIDFTNPKGVHIIEKWYEAAKDPVAFFSARSDQNALSIILYQLGLTNQMWSLTTLGDPNHKWQGTLFLMDRPFVKP